MPPQYLLPCDHCNHPITIVPKQAGQDLKCPQCQHSIEVPKLGSMKQLEMADGSQPADGASESSGGRRNLLFVVGLALAIICGTAGYFVYGYAGALMVEINYDQEQQSFEEEVDHLNPAQVVALYEAMQIENGLGEWYEPPYVHDNTQGAYLQIASYALMGLSGMGLLILTGSFFLKR